MQAIEACTRETGITALFKYLAPLDQLDPPGVVYRYVCTPPPGEKEHNEVLHEHRHEVTDIRGNESAIGLDLSGFDVLYDCADAPLAWADDPETKDLFYEYTINLLKKRLRASRVTIFDHTVRTRNPETDHLPDASGKRQPVYRAHIDQTPAAGRYRVYKHEGVDAERLLRTRVQIINVWRPLRGPVVDAPLGLCHRDSVTDEDLVEAELRYKDRVGSTYLVHYNPSHRWYYLSEMQTDETILIKCYDNLHPDKIAVHSAFIIPPPAATPWQPRYSIEMRCLVFYEDQPLPA